MTDDATAAVEVAQEAGYALSQVDVDHVFEFFALLSICELAQLAVLVIVAGLIVGALVTRKWTV